MVGGVYLFVFSAFFFLFFFPFFFFLHVAISFHSMGATKSFFLFYLAGLAVFLFSFFFSFCVETRIYVLRLG